MGLAQSVVMAQRSESKTRQGNDTSRERARAESELTGSRVITWRVSYIAM